MKKVLIGLIVVLAILLRSPEIISGNFIFNFDAGRDLLVAKSIIEEGKLTLIGAEIGSGNAGINGIFQGPGYHYLLAVSYFIGNGNPYSALVLMFVFGMATVGATYFTVRKMLGEWEAIVALFLVAVSPMIVPQSRFLWAPHPGTLFIILYLYFMYLLPKRPRLYSTLAVLSAGMTYHFELAMTVPMILASFIALPTLYNIRDSKTYLYSFFAAFASFSPLILFEARHGWVALQSLLSYISPKGPTGTDVLLLRITDHVTPYIKSAAFTFPTEKGFLQEGMFALLAALLIVVLVKSKDKFFQFMFLLMVTTYVSLLFLDNTIWDYYLIHINIIIIYIFAWFVISIIRGVKKHPWHWITLGFLGVLVSSMFVSVGNRVITNYRHDLVDVGGVEKIKGKIQAIDYVYKDAKGEKFNVFVFTPPIYTYPYDYLFATYGKNTYGYEPGKEKKGLVYLIIEPDPAKPWTYKGWLETVIVDGKVVLSTTLSTGHIIEKRLFPL